MPPKPGECTPGKMASITDDKERSKFMAECNKANAASRPSSFARAEQQAQEQRAATASAGATAPATTSTDPGHARSVADPVANLFGGGLENTIKAIRKPGNGRIGP